MKISDVMTADVEYCSLDTSLADVAIKMKELDVGVMPICDNDQLVGLCTDRDLVINGLANKLSGRDPVSKVMTEDPTCGTKQMSAEEAAELMADQQIRRLPIVEDGKLIGIVSLGDLAVEQRLEGEAGEALEKISYPSEPN